MSYEQIYHQLSDILTDAADNMAEQLSEFVVDDMEEVVAGMSRNRPVVQVERTGVGQRLVTWQDPVRIQFKSGG